MAHNKPDQAHELGIPTPAFAGAMSLEVARVWMVDGEWHFSLRMGDPGPVPVDAELDLWGSLLHEFALHLAVLFHKRDGRDVMETANALTEAFTTAMRETSPK